MQAANESDSESESDSEGTTTDEEVKKACSLGPDSKNVQLGTTGDYFFPFEKGMLGAEEYQRVVPARFEGDGDDIFMRSVIRNYALEGKDKKKGKDGEEVEVPNGKFFLDEVQSKALATEVLTTHKGLSGANLKKYLDTYWTKSWGHFDVNQTGMIDAAAAPRLMRFLASDQYFSLQ